jgi:hypothetical protein
MNHTASVENKAVERYILGELSLRERDEFEEHFFECLECAGDVCVASAMAHGVRAHFGEAPATARQAYQEKQRSWLSWMRLQAAVPAAAAFALFTLTVYQNAIVLPGLRSAAAESAQPQVLPSALLVSASRSALPSISVPASARFFQLSLELPPAEALGSYECELRSDAGQTVWNLHVSVSANSDDISLLIPAARLRSGEYGIFLRGSGSEHPVEISPFRFRLSRP